MLSQTLGNVLCLQAAPCQLFGNWWDIKQWRGGGGDKNKCRFYFAVKYGNVVKSTFWREGRNISLSLWSLCKKRRRRLARSYPEFLGGSSCVYNHSMWLFLMSFFHLFWPFREADPPLWYTTPFHSTQTGRHLHMIFRCWRLIDFNFSCYSFSELILSGVSTYLTVICGFPVVKWLTLGPSVLQPPLTPMLTGYWAHWSVSALCSCGRDIPSAPISQWQRMYKEMSVCYFACTSVLAWPSL